MDVGKLLLVATPIGNLGDITLRALEALREADVVAAEDTRRTVKLLNHYAIKNKLVSFHEYSREARFEEILGLLAVGKKVALVSERPSFPIPDTSLYGGASKRGLKLKAYREHALRSRR